MHKLHVPIEPLAQKS